MDDFVRISSLDVNVVKSGRDKKGGEKEWTLV